MMLRSMLIALAVLLGGCASVPEPLVRPDIYVMRHLHTPAGANNPDLTPVGQQHAVMLDRWFAGRGAPEVIYVSDTVRARQTAAVLAARLTLVPKLYDPRDTAGLVAAVLAESGTVLVVAHSNTVPDIVAGLGGMRPAPLVHEDFGDVWRVAGPGRVTTHFLLGE
jgi:broad specificity phosphatase PhoE